LRICTKKHPFEKRNNCALLLSLAAKVRLLCCEAAAAADADADAADAADAADDAADAAVLTEFYLPVNVTASENAMTQMALVTTPKTAMPQQETLVGKSVKAVRGQPQTKQLT
jgi:hypothetical protein